MAIEESIGKYRPAIQMHCGPIVRRCRQRFKSALAFSLMFRLLNLALLAPLAAAVVHLGLKLWGRASVGNFEIIRFFFSPVGLAAVVIAASVVVVTLYLELSGLLRIVADDRLHWWEAFKSSTRLVPRLLHLGLVQLAIYLALALPFLAGIGLAYWWFWSGKDLNGLIILRPKEFWWGIASTGIFLAAFGVLALRQFLRQLYAVPILILEPGATVRSALASSAERSQRASWRAPTMLACWMGMQSLAAAAVLEALHVVLTRLLHHGSSSLTLLVFAIGSVFATHAAVVAILSVVANLSFVGVVLVLYQWVSPEHRVLNEDTELALPRARRRLSLGWTIALTLMATAVAVVVTSSLYVRGVKINDQLEITAHRAGASVAPENTVAALNRAILDRADWAEIDVQRTADDVLVVMHDIDLARVGGGARRVDQVTLAEIQKLDVGTRFSPEFAGERIPTFAEMLAAAGNRIRLNVELKPHTRRDADELTKRVIDAIRKAGMVSRCRICSQSYESLQLAKQLEPSLDVGYIVATVVGDPTRLDVNFLMMKSNLATRDFGDRAALRGIAVHAWTVNDPTLVAPLLDAGVTNLITDDPAAIRVKLDEIRALDTPQRLLLRAAHAIAE